MSSETVLIDDDDVDMEPVVILDEEDDKMVSEKTAAVPTVETIVLDDETPIVTGVGTVNNGGAKIDNKQKSLKKSEEAFVNNLRNNRLMDKIVTRCINMENAGGMPRVIHKTLLPLYRDANNTFKESELFRKLLKKIYKMLVVDPDHKFLHIKTLCEELKSGGLRKKVPFVTLATNLKNNGYLWRNEELNSSCREVNQNVEDKRQISKVDKKNNKRKRNGGKCLLKKAKQSKSCPIVNTKDRIKTRSITQTEKEKNDIIDLDNSENESVDSSKHNDGQTDVIIIDETELSDERNNNLSQVLQEATEEDSNKENDELENKNDELSADEMDYELLIPQNQVEVLASESEVPVPHSPTDLERIASIEKQIADYKLLIDKLEKEEVTTENPYLSPYYLCSKYKKKVVECYKKICEINGNSEDIVKRREIRLHVAEGHPPGPAKRLEWFLNKTIDSTGAVAFPDFSDVVSCVMQSNVADALGWSRQQVFQEAAALFRECGQALRKRRQKREYRDLLSLVRNMDHNDDPAEKDPILLAKLEENKLIAKIKEKEILERYVSMENNASPGADPSSSIVGNAVEFESDVDSSGLDSESEQNVSLTNNITTATNNNQCETGEYSESNITCNNLDLLQTNSVAAVGHTPINNQFEIGATSRCNDIIINNIKVTMTVSPLTFSPMLTMLLNAPARSPNHVVYRATNNNQCAIGESSKTNDTFSNNHSDVLPTNTRKSTPDTIRNECETSEYSETENKETCDVKDIQSNVSRTSDVEVPQNCDLNTSKMDVKVKIEGNTLDVQSMLDELGDSFVCQVFDIEDPFLVIEISSDGFTDDEEL